MYDRGKCTGIVLMLWGILDAYSSLRRSAEASGYLTMTLSRSRLLLILSGLLPGARNKK